MTAGVYLVVYFICLFTMGNTVMTNSNYPLCFCSHPPFSLPDCRTAKPPTALRFSGVRRAVRAPRAPHEGARRTYYFASGARTKKPGVERVRAREAVLRNRCSEAVRRTGVPGAPGAPRGPSRPTYGLRMMYRDRAHARFDRSRR